MQTFPDYAIEESKDVKNIANSIFGNRFLSDQTLYEYLIEFLLVFSSEKYYLDGKYAGAMMFHDNIENEMRYYVEPRMGLRRFIFFDKAKKDGSIVADNFAYNAMLEKLKKRINSEDDEQSAEIIDDLQDLLYGYAVIVRKRAWCAQAMLPVCKELIFCGSMPNQKVRRSKVNWASDKCTVDKFFDFTKRNFLARGGEVYYLHLLQGLQGKHDKKVMLEKLIKQLLTNHNAGLSKIANFIQNSWEKEISISDEDKIKALKIGYIPSSGYVGCEAFSVDELVNFLSIEMQPIKKIELLANGIMLQVMRMMTYCVSAYLGTKRKSWVIDMRASTSIKKIAALSLNSVEEDFVTALNKKGNELVQGNLLTQDELIKEVRRGKTNSWDIFKAKGKEMQCIIPVRGASERFTLSEDIIRFLVLSLIEPGEKMTVDMFLEKLYKHFDIVIGPKEYKEAVKNGENLSISLTNNFEKNENAFQDFLKDTGFLRELSDATSIVVNPYTKLNVKDVEL